MTDAIERNAETQNRYRNLNECVAEVHRRFAAGVEAEGMTDVFELFCECGQQAPCGERVQVDEASYERVRSDPTTFLLFP